MTLIFPHFCSNDFHETWLWYEIQTDFTDLAKKEEKLSVIIFFTRCDFIKKWGPFKRQKTLKVLMQSLSVCHGQVRPELLRSQPK